MRSGRVHVTRRLAAAATVTAAVASLGTAGLAVAAPSSAASTVTVVINEVQTSGDTPDFIELTNTGAATVDISGFQLLDDADDHDRLVVPAGTSLPAGGFVAFDTDPPFGLGGGSDSARLYAADGTTLLDSYTWTTEATTSHGRCPDGTGDFAVTASATRGAANDCLPAPPSPVRTDAVTWPGSPDVTVADEEGVLGEDLSGLYFEPSPGVPTPAAGAATGTAPVAPPDVLWAVKNDPGVLYRLLWNGTVWAPDTANGWAEGKQLRYPDGTGEPDSEGVTLVYGTSSNGVFVSTERDNTDDEVSKPAILRFDVSGSGTELVATDEWDMTADLPPVGPNLGFEALTWVPDTALVSDGLAVSPPPATPAAAAPARTLYDPTRYGTHFGGLFLAGLEADGNVYAYALDDGGTRSTRVTSFSSGFPTVMELQYDEDRHQLRAICDNTCTGQQTVLELQDGQFGVVAAYNRPVGLPDVNNEGFATAPDRDCVDGSKLAIWADDDGTDGHALRQGTVTCTLPGSSTPPTPSPTPSGTGTGTATPPLAATGASTGQPLGLGLAALAAGAALVAFGVRRGRGRHAA